MSTIFGNKRFASATAPVYEGYGVEINGDLIALQESYDDQMNIIKALHAIDSNELASQQEVKALQESGASSDAIADKTGEFEVATESMVKNAWERIKEFFKKLWGKLKAYFASVVRFFDGLFKSSQDFVKKYEGQLRKLNLHGYEFKMFNYTNLDNYDAEDAKGLAKDLYESIITDVANTSESNLQALKEDTEKMKEYRDDELAKLRASMVPGSGGNLTAEEFKEELYGLFRDGAKGEDDKKDVKVDINEIIATIKNTTPKKKMEEMATKADAEFTKVIKAVDAAQAKLGNAKEDKGNAGSYTHTYNKGKDSEATATYSKDARSIVLDALQQASSVMTAVKDASLEATRMWREAWTERDRTYKSVCVGAFRYKKAD